ncbi:putative glycosyl transferase [Kocuria rosea]|nr:putative glycosyl transferase [Kocuria rosea]
MELDFGLRSVLADWSEPDVVLFVSPGLFSSAVAVLRAKLSRRRPGTAVWVQDLYSRGLEELHASAASLAPVMRAVESATLRAVNRTIVIHDRFYHHVVDGLGVDAQRVFVQRNWSHIAARSHVDVAAVRRGRGWATDDIVVLHAGNMGLKQNLENVVESARIATETGSRVRIVLLGAGSQRQRLHNLAKGVDRLDFIDPLPDDEYRDVLAAADILLVNESPELREMCVPSKLTSYFSTGRPVLAAVNKGSATAGEVEASKAGVVIAPGDPHQLVRAAEEMGADRASASALGDHGPAYATEHLSTATAMCRWDEVLRALLQPSHEPMAPDRLQSPSQVRP